MLFARSVEDKRIEIGSTVHKSQREFLFDVHSMQYNYHIVGHGIVLNPEVCQLLTPASLRSEHPLATIVGWAMSFNPDFQNMKVLVQHLSMVEGAFAFVATNSLRTRAIVVVKGLPFVWDNAKGYLVKNTVPDSTGSMLVSGAWFLAAENGSVLDCLSVDIPLSRPERRLFVVESFREDWTVPYRNPHDYKVSYAQIDYKSVNTHMNLGKHGPWWLNFVSRCLAFALDFPSNEVPTAIVLGIKPAQVDLLLLSALTRVVHAATTGQIQLEAPLYEATIGHRITAAV